MAIDREKFIDEIVEAGLLYAEDSEQAKFLLELAKSLEGISDNEFKKWAIVNGPSIFKYLPDDSELYKSAASMKEPDSWINDKPDLEKMFNSKNVEDVSPERVKGVAESNGYTEEQVKKAIEEQRTRQNRIDQMYGTNFLQQLFTPRLYEKRLRDGVDVPIVPFLEDGALDTWKDLGLDIFENGLYLFNPFGRIGQMGRVGKALSKAGTAGKVLESIGSAAANPLAMEIADAIAYDDPENDRSDFSLGDVLMGTGTNLGAPLAMKMGLGGISRMAGGFGPAEKLNKWAWNLGKGDKQTVLKEIAENNKRYESMKEKIQKNGRAAFDDEELKWFDEWEKGYSENNNFFDDVLSNEGKNLEDQFKTSYKKNSGESETQALQAISKDIGDEIKKIVPGAEIDEEALLEIMKKETSNKISDMISKSNYAKANNKSLKSPDRVKGEQAIIDFITNKYGDIGYDSDKNFSLPGIGTLAKEVREYETEKKEAKAKEKAKKKYKVPTVEAGEPIIEAETDETDIDKIIARDSDLWEKGLKPWSGFEPSEKLKGSPEVRAYQKWQKSRGGK